MEEIMSKEAFEEIIDNIEIISNLTLYARKNIKYYFNRLQEENKQLKEEIEKKDNKIKQYENMILEHKKQLHKSGIYGYDYDLELLESEK